MAKKYRVEMQGMTLENLPNAAFKVKLENEHTVLGYISGKCACTIFAFCQVTR